MAGCLYGALFIQHYEVHQKLFFFLSSLPSGVRGEAIYCLVYSIVKLCILFYLIAI